MSGITQTSRTLLVFSLKSPAGVSSLSAVAARKFSTTSESHEKKSFRMVVVGGGAGGCTMANKFASKFGKDQVAVIEPSVHHYFQPMFTLVGGGIRKFSQTEQKTENVLSKKAVWIHDKAVAFDPQNSTLTTGNGDEISYEYLVVALGIQMNYHLIKGFEQAVKEDPMVVSNYHPSYVQKTWPAVQSLQSGNAIFTFPNTPIKCAGAPQKIMYLLEHHLRKNGKKDKVNVMYNSAMGVIFGVKKYAYALKDICEERGIALNLKRNLVAIRPEKREADFEILDETSDKMGELDTFKYDLLHVVPPMSAPSVLQESPLSDGTGYLAVNKETLQHVAYPNVFGIGDCTNIPTSKTAAAVASQCGVLRKTINSVIAGKEPKPLYDGYTSCPLVTGYSSCIMAEFDFNGNPKETFPVNQAKERYSMLLMKREIFPRMYWHMMLKGFWEGPDLARKFLHFGFAPTPKPWIEPESVATTAAMAPTTPPQPASTPSRSVSTASKQK